MKKAPHPIIVIGTSGLAREMAQLIGQINAAQSKQWEMRGFVSETADDIGKDLRYGMVLGDDEWLLSRRSKCALVIGVGHPKIREKIAANYGVSQTFTFPNLIHPTAVVGDTVDLGIGNVIAAGCIFTCDIKAGNNNLFNWNTTIGHDVTIGNNCVFNPASNISGNVRVSNSVLVGAGAQVLEHLAIGEGASVGAGAVVTKDVASGATVIGVPALQVKPGRAG